MSVEVIVNPVHPEGLQACERVQALCARADVPVRVRPTSIARPHGDPAPEAALTVVIGGDGTLREVAGAVVAAPSWRGALLPVPTGTADLFALNVGIRRTADGLRVLEDVLGGEVTSRSVIHCDLGWATLERAGGGASAGGTASVGGRTSAEQPFLVNAGIGHSGGALLRTPGWAKDVGGASGYGVGALTRLTASPLPVTVSAGEGADRVDRDLGVWAVEFGNISHIPYGITVFPHGGVRTGELAGLLVVPSSGREESSAGAWSSVGARPSTGTKPCVRTGSVARTVLGARSVPAARTVPSWGRIFQAGICGGHERVDDLDLMSVTSARVRSIRPLPVHLDGEAAGLVTSLQVRVAPEALPVVVPNR